MLIRIQARDREVMSELSKFGILSTKQITDWYFKNADRNTVLRRLRILEKHQLIYNSSHLPSGMKAWSLSKSGASIINVHAPFRYSNRNTTFHDVCLSGVRKCLEDSGVATDWTSDIELKRELPHTDFSNTVVPDGLFLATINGEESVVALELELHAKSHARYRSIFNDYVFRPAVSHILYVVKEAKIIKPVAQSFMKNRMNHKLKSTQKLFFILLEELETNLLTAKICFPAGHEKYFHEVFKNRISCPPKSFDIVHPRGNSKTLEVSSL